MSLRLARPLVEADPRDIDTETVDVVSAIALDETRPQDEVESQSNGYSFVHEDKTVNFATTLREAKQLVVAELRDIDTETVVVVSAIALDETSPQDEVKSQSSGYSFVREGKICKP